MLIPDNPAFGEFFASLRLSAPSEASSDFSPYDPAVDGRIWHGRKRITISGPFWYRSGELSIQSVLRALSRSIGLQNSGISDDAAAALLFMTAAEPVPANRIALLNQTLRNPRSVRIRQQIVLK